MAEMEIGSAEWIENRLRENDECIRRFRNELGDTARNPFRFPEIGLSASPALVRPGETVKITFTAHGTIPPSGAAFLTPDYLACIPGPTLPLVLRWEPCGEGAWRAIHTLRPDRPGNWLVAWDADQRRVSRVFGVVEHGRAVVTLWVGSNVPRIDEEIHRYGLPGDTWVGDWWSPFDRPLKDVLDYVRTVAEGRFSYGDRAAPFINAGWLLPGIRDMNILHLDPDIQRTAFCQARETMELVGLGPMELVASYTPGHETPKVLGELGVKGLTSLCVWQNVRDGKAENAWLINHMGAPNAPYFIAPDDFRKVGPAPAAVLGFSMGTTSNVRCYDWFGYEGCATNCMPSQRYTGNTAVSSNIHRFFLTVDGWIHDAANNPDLLFVTAALENFHQSAHWREANRQAVDYMVRRAGEGKIVFASAADIADFYRRHYPIQPENVHYWRDCYSGLRYEEKPDELPDRIEMSTNRFHSLHVEGEVLPQFLWDYTVPWSDAEWEEQIDVRNRFGMVHPGQIASGVNPLGSCPRQADTRGASARVTLEDRGGRTLVRLHVEIEQPLHDLPLAVWNLPFAADADCSIARTVRVDADGRADARIVRIRDGWTGNPSLLVILENAAAGSWEIDVNVSGRPQPVGDGRFDIGGRISARTFRTAEGSRTYFWSASANDAAIFALRVRDDRRCHVILNDGSLIRPDSGGNAIIPVGSSWRDESPCMVLEGDAESEDAVAFGPVAPQPLTGFVRTWEISGRSPTPEEIASFAALSADKFQWEPMTAGAEGYAAIRKPEPPDKGCEWILLRCRVRCEEPMELAARFGYDGPLAVRVDGVEAAYDPHGPRRPMPDTLSVPISAGRGTFTVIAALGSGVRTATGVSLRFERTDLTQSAVIAGPGAYRLPIVE